MESKKSKKVSILLTEAVLPKFKNLTIKEVFDSCDSKQFINYFRTICVRAIEKYWGNIEDFELNIKDKSSDVEFYAYTSTADDAGHAPGKLEYDFKVIYDKKKFNILVSLHVEYEVERVEDNVDANNGYYRADEVDVSKLIPSNSKTVEIDIAVALKMLLNHIKVSRLETEYEDGPPGREDL